MEPGMWLVWLVDRRVSTPASRVAHTVDKGPGASPRNARAISQRPGRRSRMSDIVNLHAKHEGAVCFGGQVTLRVPVWNRRRTGRGAEREMLSGQCRIESVCWTETPVGMESMGIYTIMRMVFLFG